MAKAPYTYQRSKSLLKFLAAVFLALIFACGATLFIIFPLTVVFEEWLGGEISGIFLWIGFGLLVCSSLFGNLRSNVQNLHIEHDTITWTKFGRKEINISRTEIQKVDWERNKIVFETAAKKHTLKLTDFPIKHRIEISSILAEWVRGNAVTFETFQFQQWKRDLSDSIDLNEKSVETHKEKGRALRWISAIGLTVAVGAIIRSFTVEPTGNTILVAILLLGMLLSLFVVLLLSTRYRRIQVNHEGIIYVNGKKETQFPWTRIEAIALQSQRILIWTGKRYKPLSYTGMNREAVNEVLTIIYYKAMTKDIAFGIV